MAIVQPDHDQSFSSPVEEYLQPSDFATSLIRSNMGSNGSSSTSSSSTAEHTSLATDTEDGPVLARLLSNRDIFPIILGHLDSRSFVSLTSISTRFRREILMPATPNLCCTNMFLQLRTVICPMAQFESLKDFMVKYRSFKPLHLHFTYCKQSSLMSLVPEVTAPIYNSKQDLSFIHPSSSPLTSSHLLGVNQSISINITSDNSLHQYHHPLTQEQQSIHQHQQQHQQQRTHHENDQRKYTDISTAQSDTRETSIETESNNEGENKGHPNSDLDAEIAAMMISPSIAIPTASPPAQHMQHRSSRSVNYTRISSDIGVNNNPPFGSSHSHPPNAHSSPILSSSSHAQSPHVPPHDQHGFELSYWQKFALNELFMRLLPFLQKLTIGRTDKPSRQARIEDSSMTSGELSAGVCFFLARCFNVMHDMPDTALESVVWMDVTIKDVALLVKMIELRDIMVDERYWRRGYWATDRLSTRDLRATEDDRDENQLAEYDDDEDDWDGFYYLLNQEGAEKKTQPPKKTSLRSVSSTASKKPQRKSGAIKGGASSSASSAPPSISRQSSTTSTPTSSSIHDRYYPKSNHSHVSAPAAWQGFGDGALVTDSEANGLFGERQLPPAVQMYEALKIEILDAANVSRTLDKGKHLATNSHI